MKTIIKRNSLTDDQLRALDSIRIVNISFAESFMDILADISNRKKLPQGITRKASAVYDYHYDIHGKMTLNREGASDLQGELTKIIKKEVCNMKDSFDKGRNISLEHYLLISVELCQVLLESITKSDIRGLVPPNARHEMPPFVPLMNSLNGFVNASNKYLHKKKFVDIHDTHKVREWGRNVIKHYSQTIFKNMEQEAKDNEDK